MKNPFPGLFRARDKPGRRAAPRNAVSAAPGFYKSRMEGYAIARQNGWMSANDIRALENLNPIAAEEGGDTYLVNGNMIPISQAGLAGAAGRSEGEPAEGKKQKEGDDT